MLLAHQLKASGLKLSHATEGPDFLVEHGGQRIWIEVITPEPKGLPDAWINHTIGNVVIVADYNSEKDRTTIEETFRRLVELVQSLDEEQERAARENLSDEELAVFDLLKRDDLNKTDRERVKQASREMLATIKQQLAKRERFWEKEQTKGEMETLILDEVFIKLPTPPFTPEEKQLVANNVYAHFWQQAMTGGYARL